MTWEGRAGGGDGFVNGTLLNLVLWGKIMGWGGVLGVDHVCVGGFGVDHMGGWGWIIFVGGLPPFSECNRIWLVLGKVLSKEGGVAGWLSWGSRGGGL